MVKMSTILHGEMELAAYPTSVPDGRNQPRVKYFIHMMMLALQRSYLGDLFLVPVGCKISRLFELSFLLSIPLSTISNVSNYQYTFSLIYSVNAIQNV